MYSPFLLSLLLACLWALALAAAPPALSETFSATLTVTVKDSRGERKGKGIWAIDHEGNKGIQGEFDVYVLSRFDLKKEYEIFKGNRSECHATAVSGNVPNSWAWLQLAKYKGSNDSLDIWESTIGYANITLAVKTSDPTTPVFMIRSARGETETRYDFTTWNTTTPTSTIFSVPSNCGAATRTHTAEAMAYFACEPTATAIAHAKDWVAAQVPYNQGATYQGYREDCSGFVSMCWESAQPGHTTETMDEIAHAITKDDLQPGDCLLFAAEHVVLFGGWTNAAQSEYQAYEETKPGEGTVTRPTPYPYWYSQSSFKPFRYNNIC